MPRVFAIIVSFIILSINPLGCSTPFHTSSSIATSILPVVPASLSPTSSSSVVSPMQKTSTTPTSTPASQLQWFGQSTFLLITSLGSKILMDPTVANTGYTINPIDGVDAVLVSHEHSDHNNVSLAKGSPVIIRGLSAAGWNNVDQTVKDVRVTSIYPVYHDNQEGSQRGRNTIFIIEFDGLRLAHLGDLGHVFTPEIIQTTGAIDILLIPVGGAYTIDASDATRVVKQLNPHLVIPMHYKTAKVPATWPGVGVEPFLEGKTVERFNSSVINLSALTWPTQTTTMVLNYE